MQVGAAGSATGNKHINHIHSAPVTVQMASPGREAGRAMKKDEQSDRAERETQRRGDKRKGEMIFFMSRLSKEIKEGGWWCGSGGLHLFV